VAKIICSAFEVETNDDQYPCSMCFCGANDFHEAKETSDGCDGCSWAGCQHKECPHNIAGKALRELIANK